MPIGDWRRCCKAAEGDARPTRRRGKFPDYLKFYHETIQRTFGEYEANKIIGFCKANNAILASHQVRYQERRWPARRMHIYPLHRQKRASSQARHGTFTTDLDTSDTNLHTALKCKDLFPSISSSSTSPRRHPWLAILIPFFKSSLAHHTFRILNQFQLRHRHQVLAHVILINTPFLYHHLWFSLFLPHSFQPKSPNMLPYLP